MRMVRPRQCRRIGHKPEATRFKPQGIPAKELEEVTLHFDELEAMRLKDYEQIEQTSAAAQMEISQPTFHRLLREARRKVVEVITTGKSLRVEGGSYVFHGKHYGCCHEHHGIDNDSK